MTARGTLERPAVASRTVHANSGQELPDFRWREGQEWRIGDRWGIWAIDRIYHVAVRVEFDDSVPAISSSRFDQQLDDARMADELAAADAHLARVDQPDLPDADEQRERRILEEFRYTPPPEGSFVREGTNMWHLVSYGFVERVGNDYRFEVSSCGNGRWWEPITPGSHKLERSETLPSTNVCSKCARRTARTVTAS